MIRIDDDCWIKVVPTIQQSIPATLYINLNDTEHRWDIYDKSGREKHNIYFKGFKITPIFYLKSGDNCYRIDCDYDIINIHPIKKKHKIKVYLKNKCHNSSSRASCWAIAIYSTRMPEKYPFNIM